MAGIGQRWMNHAARTATAIHIAWKYLFMSKSITLSWTTFGTRKRPMSHAPRNACRGTFGASERKQRQRERHAEVGEVEEDDRGDAVGVRRRLPRHDRGGSRPSRLPGAPDR